MFENEDKQFFDELYQLWSRTTGAKDRYWMPVQDEEAGSFFSLVAADTESDMKKHVASFLCDEDAEFIAGLHGAVPDLIRRLHEALDEAVAKDEARDDAEGKLADALLENLHLRSVIHELEIENGNLSRINRLLKAMEHLDG